MWKMEKEGQEFEAIWGCTKHSLKRKKRSLCFLTFDCAKEFRVNMLQMIPWVYIYVISPFQKYFWLNIIGKNINMIFTSHIIYGNM